MERKIYQPTEKQLKKWPQPGQTSGISMTDEEIKAAWKKSHGGKVAGWGMKKRDMVLTNMTGSYEYQLGIWQGRVDRANGLDYSEERNESAYNLGYYRGYDRYESDCGGWDKEVYRQFIEKYVG